MKRGATSEDLRFIALLILLVLLAPSIPLHPSQEQPSPNIQMVLADDVEIAPLDVIIEPDEFHYAQCYLNHDDCIYGSFEVISGSPIRISIAPQDSFDVINGSGGFYWAYVLGYSVIEHDWSFTAPYNDTWYIIYSNENTDTNQTHVVGSQWIDRTAPDIEIDPAEGGTYSDTICIDISVSDEVAHIRYLRVFIDNSLFYNYTALFPFFSYGTSYNVSLRWDTSEMDDGSHTICVIACDRGWNVNEVEIQVNTDNFLGNLADGLSSLAGPATMIGVSVLITMVLVVVILRKYPHLITREPTEKGM